MLYEVITITEARVLVHSFDLERFNGVSSEGLKAAEEGLTAGRRAFAELRDKKAIDNDLQAKIKAALDEFKGQFAA